MAKKMIAVILLMGMILSLTACGGKASSSKQSSNPQAAQTEGAKKSENRVVRIGYPQFVGEFANDLFGIAQEKGFLKEELEKIGVTVKYVPFAGAGPAVNEAFVSKDIDLAVYGDVPALVLKSKGADISLFAISQSNYNSALIVKKDSTIGSFKDLKGMKVAVAKGTINQRYLDEALAAEGLSVSDLQIVNLNIGDSGSALITGKVDAIVNTSSNGAKLSITQKEAKIIADSKDHPDWSGIFAAVGRNEYLKENSDVAVALVKSLIKSRDFVKANKEEAFNIWTKAGIDVDSAKYTYGYDDSFKFFPVEITDSSIAKLNNVVKFLLQNNLIKNEVDINKFVDKSYYEEAVKK